MRTTGTRGDDELARRVFELIAFGKSKQLQEMCEFLDACVEMFHRQNIPDNKTIESYVRVSLLPSQELAIWLYQNVIELESPLHPRLVVLPFLRILKKARAAATKALRLIEESGYVAPKKEKVQGKLTRTDAKLALGITSHHVLKRLGRRRLLSDKIITGKMRGPVVSLARVNNLLIKLYVPGRQLSTTLRPLTVPLEEVIESALSNRSANFGYDLASGLTTLRLKLEEGNLSKPNRSEIDLREAARVIQVHTDVVRSLARLEYIAPLLGHIGTKPLLFNLDDVLRFNDEFVFASVLGKTFGVNTLKCSTRLIARGIKPVSGPTIDGLLTYLFRRDQLPVENLREMVSSMPGLLERKGSAPRALSEYIARMNRRETISLIDMSSDLRLTVRQMAKIVRTGLLKRMVAPGRQVQVRLDEYLAFRARFNDPNFIEIEAAAAAIGDNVAEFRSKYVETGLIKVVDFCVKLCVARKDYVAIENLRKSYITAREAARARGSGRYELPNLEARGRIVSVRMGGKRKIRLFRLTDFNDSK